MAREGFVDQPEFFSMAWSGLFFFWLVAEKVEAIYT